MAAVVSVGSKFLVVSVIVIEVVVFLFVPRLSQARIGMYKRVSKTCQAFSSSLLFVLSVADGHIALKGEQIARAKTCSLPCILLDELHSRLKRRMGYLFRG